MMTFEMVVVVPWSPLFGIGRDVDLVGMLHLGNRGACSGHVPGLIHKEHVHVGVPWIV